MTEEGDFMKKYFSITCAILFSLMIFSTVNKKVLACNSNEVQDKAIHPKEVFLTFDDGPSENNTKEILKTLKDNNVRATFFIVGMKSEENPKMLKELSESGMSIGIHTYSHDYKIMYKSLEEYIKDFEKCRTVIKNVTGREPISYIRLPGGSDNLVTSKSNLESIKKTLNDNGLKYVDWNVCAGDAESTQVTVEKVKNNIISQCKDKNFAVVLMHDTYYKKFTAEALPEVIKYLQKEGFVFRTFDDLTPSEEDKMVKMGILNRK